MNEKFQNKRLEENESKKNAKMKKISHIKGWILGMRQVHVKTLLITLIKEKYNGKSKKYFVKLKLRTDPTSSA